MSGSYAGYILGAYGAAALILGAMIIGSLVSYRTARARLARIERHGAEKRR
ncbi:cytochro_ccmD, heme exporter protein CcmD [Rhabdaerophilaceae bacterium]